IDFLRASARSGAGTSFERTSTLCTPSRSMSASARRSAPAPMESMAMTAATPNIMPRVDRPVRMRREERFSRAKRTASEAFMLGSTSAGRGGRTAEVGGALARIAERDHVALAQPRRDDDGAGRGGAEHDLGGEERTARLAPVD